MSKILIVDDEKSLRVTLCAFLQNEGYEAACAENAEEACALLEKEKFDVIVTDIIMPRMSGMELLHTAKVLYPDIQIIVMTGEPTVETAISAVHSGAHDYLTKPIHKKEFLYAVYQATRVKQLEEEKTVLAQQNVLYQKHLEDVVYKRTGELQKAMQGIISLLTYVVEIKDPYTAGHQVRVGNLAAAIARKMNADEKTVDFIRMIGYIHDIGKISVPSEILVKPGRLNELEMAFIRNHPASGYELLQKGQLPAFIGEAIYQHHERCDGSGYPRGLMGSEIMQEAQIIMVADVVEAMMSHRPYRPALGLDMALDEIKNNTGRYHPDIVKACEALFRQDGYQIEDEQYPVFLSF